MSPLTVPLLVMSPIVMAAGFVLATTPPVSDPNPVRFRIPVRSIVASGLISLIVLASTGWFLPSVVIGVGVVAVVRSSHGARNSARLDAERLDAVALWLENLRDVLVAGEQPLGAVVATAARSPIPIRSEVRRLARGLIRYEPAIMLERFADELDDPVGDLVATGLRVAIERGGRTAAVLDTLAEHTRHSTERRRLIDAERAPIVREVGLVTWIMAALMIGIILTGRSGYLSVYSTPSGQIFLSGALIAYGLLVVRVRRLARFERPARLKSTRVA